MVRSCTLNDTCQTHLLHFVCILLLMAYSLFISDGTPASFFSTCCCCYCPWCWGLSVEHTCDNFEVSLLFFSPVVSLFARLFRKAPTSSTACDLKLLTQFQVSDLKEYADDLFCCVLCVSRIYISMNFCLSAGSLWCLAPHSSVFGSFNLIHHQLWVLKGFAVFPPVYPNGFYFMLCSAPIDNLHFLVCENCSAAQWVLCVTVEMPPTMSTSEFLF